MKYTLRVTNSMRKIVGGVVRYRDLVVKIKIAKFFSWRVCWWFAKICLSLSNLALLSVIKHGPYMYLKWTQVLCVLWGYRLWAACPCLSWSAVAFSRSIGMELGSEESIVSTPPEKKLRALARVQIWNVHAPSCPFVQSKFRYMHAIPMYQLDTHASCKCSHTTVGLAQARPN